MNRLLILLLGCLAIACSNRKDTTTTKMDPDMINGTWEANYILGTPKPFDAMYGSRKPYIIFDATEKSVSGMNGCNNFMGSYAIDGKKIGFGGGGGLAVTRRMCPDMGGEEAFMNALKKVNTYSISEDGNTLNLISGDMAVMRFDRKIEQ